MITRNIKSSISNIFPLKKNNCFQRRKIFHSTSAGIKSLLTQGCFVLILSWIIAATTVRTDDSCLCHFSQTCTHSPVKWENCFPPALSCHSFAIHNSDLFSSKPKEVCCREGGNRNKVFKNSIASTSTYFSDGILIRGKRALFTPPAKQIRVTLNHESPITTIPIYLSKESFLC